MRWMAALLGDRRRSQRGSVLTGVLIITAFVAIIAGALMTELSTNFLLSRAMVHRTSNQATVNSELELAISKLSGQPIYQGCPGLPQASLNGSTAAATYVTCGPTIDSRRNSSAVTRLAASASITVDGTLTSQNGYVVGDSSGDAYQYSAGALSRYHIGGSVSGPPQVMPADGTLTVPVVNPTVPADVGCPTRTCVAVFDPSDTTPECYLSATASVLGRPAAGINNRGYTFFAASDASLYAYYTWGGQCTFAGRVQLTQPGFPPLSTVASVAVFAGPTGATFSADEVFVGVTDGSSSWLQQLEFRQNCRSRNGQCGGGFNGGAFTWFQTWGLVPGRAVGGSFDSTTLPARLAVSFTNGDVEILQVQSGVVTPTGSWQLPTGLSGTPAWCCRAAPNRIGVGGQNGRFYVLDAGLAGIAATYNLGAAINSTASVDGGGDWFVGADDGNVWEIPAIQAAPTTWSFGQNAFGSVRSSVQVASCGGSVCAYLGASNGGAYVVQLDTRQVVMWACIGPATTSCTGENPRLWAAMQVGSLSSVNAVHISVWSYYSP